MEKKIFKEKQGYRGREVNAILFIAAIAVSLRLFYIIGISPAPSTGAIMACLTLLVLVGFTYWYFQHVTLSITVNHKGISYRMSPWHARKHSIRWSEVDSFTVIKSPRWAQWHGDNVTFATQHSYSLCGRNGIEIRKKNGATVFLGTRRLTELENAVRLGWEEYGS